MISTCEMSHPASGQTSERLHATEAESAKVTRFTLDGSDKLEADLNQICQKVLAEVLDLAPRKKLQGVLLGGSYGRGEGGVWRTRSGERPYSNLQFYIFLRGSQWLNEQKNGDVFNDLAKGLSATFKIPVEFKVLSLSGLRRSGPNMFYYDLVSRHRWIWGAENFLQGCDHHRQSFRVPEAEAIRLLMNRCSALLFTRQYIEQEVTAMDKLDQIQRSIAKLQLALGDAVLTVYGQYHWSCVERHERLMRLAPDEALVWLEEVRQQHAAGLEFKLHPTPGEKPWETLRAEHAHLSALTLRVWLWLENHRLKQRFVNVRDYCLSPINKCPETRSWRNRMVNTLTFGPELFWEPSSAHSPRERLLNALPLLLWESQSVKEPALLKSLHTNLQTLSSTYTGLLAAYEKLWQQFK